VGKQLGGEIYETVTAHIGMQIPPAAGWDVHLVRLDLHVTHESEL
jgi:hypothetical protein